MIGKTEIKGTFQNNRKLKFSDAAVEAGIRKVIGKSSGAIMTKDVDLLESLDFSKSEVRNLTGIGALVNLVSLSLRENEIVEQSRS